MTAPSPPRCARCGHGFDTHMGDGKKKRGQCLDYIFLPGFEEDCPCPAFVPPAEQEGT